MVNRRLFIVQVRDDSPGADVCINRVNSAGAVTGHLHVDNAGHAGSAEDPYNSLLAALYMTTREVVQREVTSAGRPLVYREPEGHAINVSSGRPQLCFGLSSPPTPTSRRSKPTSSS